MSLKFTFQNQDFAVGDSLKINYKIREKDKERIQAFDGVVLAIQGRGTTKSIIVQKSAADGIKVERIFPLDSPWIDSIKRIRSAKTKLRRSKLYYLRRPQAEKTV